MGVVFPSPFSPILNEFRKCEIFSQKQSRHFRWQKMGECDDICWEMFRQLIAREIDVKMSKTNKKQIEMLLNLMQTHQDIARGFFKGGKDELNRFWRKAEEELNSAGPPSKSITEWKKVWLDQKKYVRQKAAQNLKASRGTGGGPNMQHSFSATEEAIFNLIGMQESVEGVANKFGLGPYVINNAPQCPKKVQVDEVPDVVVQNFFEELEESTQASSKYKEKNVPKEKATQKRSSADVLREEPEESTTQASSKQKRQKKVADDVLREELAIQREICNAMKEQQQVSKKIYRSIDRLHDLHKMHYIDMKKAKGEKLAELKRHHTVMEQLRLRELEDKLEKFLDC